MGSAGRRHEEDGCAAGRGDACRAVVPGRNASSPARSTSPATKIRPVLGDDSAQPDCDRAIASARGHRERGTERPGCQRRPDALADRGDGRPAASRSPTSGKLRRPSSWTAPLAQSRHPGDRNLDNITRLQEVLAVLGDRGDGRQPATSAMIRGIMSRARVRVEPGRRRACRATSRRCVPRPC